MSRIWGFDYSYFACSWLLSKLGLFVRMVQDQGAIALYWTRKFGKLFFPSCFNDFKSQSVVDNSMLYEYHEFFGNATPSSNLQWVKGMEPTSYHISQSKRKSWGKRALSMPIRLMMFTKFRKWKESLKSLSTWSFQEEKTWQATSILT